MKAAFFCAVVQNHIEASRKSNDELVEILVCMPAALGASGYVVKIIDAFDIEGDVPTAFNEGEIASRVVDSGEVNDLAVGQARQVGFLYDALRAHS